MNDFLSVATYRATPVIQQSEASECGLVCLAMVAGHHGLKIDMPAMRQRFSISLKGASLKTLIRIGETLGFFATPLRGEIADLDAVALPAVLHWDLNHFVVLNRIAKKWDKYQYEIYDPARGVRSIGAEELSRHFTGIILQLEKAAVFQAKNAKTKFGVGQLWSNISGLWPILGSVLILSIVLQFITLALPFYLQISIDTVMSSYDRDLLTTLAVGFGGLVVIQTITGWLRSKILISAGSSLSYQIVVNLFRHLIRLPLSWYEKRHVGDIISRFGSTRPIADLLAQGAIASAIDGLMAFATLCLMLIYSPILAAIAIFAWFLFAGCRIAFIKVLRARNIDAISMVARENSCFIESVRGIAAIKAFGQEGSRQRIWQQHKTDAVNAEIRLARLSSAFDHLGQFILSAERICFVYIAISEAMAGLLTVGMIFAFQSYKQQFLDASTRLVEQALRYKLLDVHLDRIADVALTKAEPLRRSDRKSNEVINGSIELRDVSFRYGVGDEEVLRGVNLEAQPGDMIFLVGPSGGGKTTVLKIMMGLLAPTSGRVLIDGADMESLGTERWRQNIGSVAQDDILFTGTLAENIAFFDPELDMERVKAVARQADIHADIEAMAMGYDTYVGDMGSALSGGQKQRILLARALYPSPAVLFIDEGTAHLDTASERRVMDVIAGLPITRVICAHRPGAVVKEAKVILVARGEAVPLNDLETER